MCADSESPAENDIVANGMDISGDVFKASNHGSETLNSDSMLDAVQPKYAIVLCGKDKQYGHQDLSVLEKFQIQRNTSL